MNIPSSHDSVHLSPLDFYVLEMRRTIEMFNSGEIVKLYYPIVSFFHGKISDSPTTQIETGHISIFLERSMQRYLDNDPQLFIRWVEVMYGYFWMMAAIPALAREIWIPLWNILEMFEGRGVNTLSARCQMAGWAASYDTQKKLIALNYIKSMVPSTQQDSVLKSLFLSTKINDGAADQLNFIEDAYFRSRYLPPIHRLQAYIHYFCKISAAREILTEIISILNWPDLEEYRKGKMELLSPLYWTLVHQNNYDDLLFFTRCLKGKSSAFGFELPHAFILPSSEGFLPALTKSDLVRFVHGDNGESYTRLIKQCNRFNQVSISLLGDDEIDFKIDEARFGTPPHDDNFDELKSAVISHYHLQDSFYQELQLISLLPSHNHPIQGALCTLGKQPPIISVSLENLAEEPIDTAFIFFLSSETFTHDLEENWIRDEFGKNAEIFTDPTCDQFVSLLNDERYTHVYISAHGVYSHWQDQEESIHFSTNSQIIASDLHAVRRVTPAKRTIVLNICDGAASPLSFNHNNSGLAAGLASGNQVVISHLWPVHPLYAGVFGMLILKELTTKSASESVLSVYHVLNQPNNFDVAESLRAIGPSFSAAADAIINASFNFSNFRNLGGIAIYS